MRSLPAALLLIAGLSGCATSIPATTNDYCRVYQPIYDSRHDTPTTRDQVLRENGKFECICHKNCPP